MIMNIVIIDDSDGLRKPRHRNVLEGHAQGSKSMAQAGYRIDSRRLPYWLFLSLHAYMHAYIHAYIHVYIHTYIHACIHTYKKHTKEELI